MKQPGLAEINTALLMFGSSKTRLNICWKNQTSGNAKFINCSSTKNFNILSHGTWPTRKAFAENQSCICNSQVILLSKWIAFSVICSQIAFNKVDKPVQILTSNFLKEHWPERYGSNEYLKTYYHNRTL